LRQCELAACVSCVVGVARSSGWSVRGRSATPNLKARPPVFARGASGNGLAVRRLPLSRA
jgi:hypothetical protein